MLGSACGNGAMVLDRVQDDSTPAGWIPLENRLYRRDSVYTTLQWTLQQAQLASGIVAVAPCAGPLALIPDAGWGLSFSLAVYTMSGRLLARFGRLREKTVPPFRAVTLAWSLDDWLHVVYSDGVVLRIPAGIDLPNAKFVRAFPKDANERVHDAAVVLQGHVVLRTASGKVITVDRHDVICVDAGIFKPSEAVVRDVPNCAIAAVKTDGNDLAVVDALIVDDTGNITHTNSQSSFTLRTDDDVSQIATSHNGKFVACFDATTGALSVRTIDLQTQVARVDLLVELSLLGVENSFSDVIFDPKVPEGIAWVGSDAVAVLYKEHVILVGPNGGTAVLPLDEASTTGSIIMQTELDGLRVISSTKVQFVQMVPQSVVNVMCNKQSAGYKLFHSSESPWDGESTMSKANGALLRYRLLRELRESRALIEGARCCVTAAYLEMDTQLQKQLLYAATYGMRNATVFTPTGGNSSGTGAAVGGPSMTAMQSKLDERSRRDINMVPTAIAIMRVVNAVSAPSGGIPLTKPQFDRLGLSAVVARLSRFGEHTFALRLATFGGISPYDVLSEWAAATIRSNAAETDEALTVLISDRFDKVSRTYTKVDAHGSRGNRALPYVKAAEAAFVAGRPKCAELLLRREVRPAPKVAMYLRMGREGPAIMAAVASGDPELVLDALGTVLEMKTVRETARLLRTLPPALGNRATDLLATHLKQIGDMHALRWLYVETGRHREATLVDIHQINAIQDTPEYIAALEKEAMSIARGNGRKTCHFEMAAVQHAANVAGCAMEVEKRGRLEAGTLRHASDGDLLARAIVDINDKTKRRDMLARLRRELRVPDRRFFWVCLDSMAEVGDFESIEALSYSAGSGRAPPIGLTAFVDTCIKHGMEEEAVKYAMRITDLRDRARALARCGRGREAADIASRLRNQQLLAEIQDLAARHVSNVAIRTRRNARAADGEEKDVGSGM